MSIGNMDSGTSVGSWQGLGDEERLLEAEERLRRLNQVALRHIKGRDNMKGFMPLLVSSLGGVAWVFQLMKS